MSANTSRCGCTTPRSVIYHGDTLLALYELPDETGHVVGDAAAIYAAVQADRTLNARKYAYPQPGKATATISPTRRQPPGADGIPTPDRAGESLYRIRKSTVEPVIGIIKEVLGFRQYLVPF